MKLAGQIDSDLKEQEWTNSAPETLLVEEESRCETDDEEGEEGGQEKSTGEGAAVEVRVRRPVQCTVLSMHGSFLWSQNFTLQINQLKSNF